MKILRNPISLSNELRYFEWHNYPYTNLLHPLNHSPSMFQWNRLVELLMPHYSSKQFWEGIE